MPPIAGEWAKALQGEFRKPYYKKLFTIVGEEYLSLIHILNFYLINVS